MCADLDDVLAGVRMRRLEVGEDNLVGRTCRRDDSRERRVARRERRAASRQRLRDLKRVRTADPDDANPAAARRRGNRNDGVVGGIHDDQATACGSLQ